MKKKIILASGSPRRKEILESLKICFEKQKSSFDEESVLSSIEDPIELVKILAYEKASSAIKCERRDGIYLGADTIVVFDEKVLGKPKSMEEAEEFLKLLSGKMHYVYTGIALIDSSSSKEFVGFGETKVYMRAFGDREIKDYIKTQEPMDKAGAYGIQGVGATLIEKIEGDFYNVMGLPIPKLVEGLKTLGIEYFDLI